jgi:triacylglycerol lipase
MFDSGYNVYSFDIPNHGVNTETTEQLYFDDYCKYLVDFINKFSLNKIYILGHSMGGGIVQAVYPQIKNKVKKVILMDPLNKGNFKNKVSTIVSAGINLIKGNFKNFTTPSQNSKFDSLLLLKNITSKESVDQMDLGLKTITCPTLIVFGENDYVINPTNSIEYFNEELKNNPHHIIKLIKDAKHSPDLENPIDF